MSVAAVGTRVARPALGVIDRAIARPRRTLAVLALTQIAVTALFGLLVATHNGWVWFQGGDQIWFTSNAWSIGHGVLPPGDIAPGWGIVLIPAAWLAGGTFVQQLPVIVALNVLVLGPLALWSLWEIATRIGGRVLALWTCVLWIVAPYVAIPLFVERYHERWIDQFLPQGIGLTAMADYPSMVAGLLVAALTVRAIDGRSWTDAALAGSVLALAVLMKPPNGLLAVGAALALLVTRRWRELGCFVLPALVGVAALGIFKVRTQGELPLLGMEETRLALAHVAAVDVERWWREADWGRYVEIDIDHWRSQMAQLREYFWSARLFQWAPLAGAVAVARFRPAIAVLLTGWLAAFVVVKGTSTQASIEANTFWRLLMPAWPAYLLLLASIVVLVPTLWRSLGDRAARPVGARPMPARGALVGVAALVAVPLLLVSVLPPLEEGQDELLLHVEGEATTLVPVENDLSLAARSAAGGVTLDWSRDWRADVAYRVYRTPGAAPDGDVACVSFGGGGAIRCNLVSPVVGVTRGTTWTDPAPVPGAVYRVAATVRYDGRVVGSDVFAFSPPAATP